MKTKKLIKYILLIILAFITYDLYAVVSNALARCRNRIEACNFSDLENFAFVWYIFLFIGTFLFTVYFIIDTVTGEYDKWFEKNTDPIITKLQNWINRRNEI